MQVFCFAIASNCRKEFYKKRRISYKYQLSDYEGDILRKGAPGLLKSKC